MSNDDYLRQQVQQTIINHPSAEKVTESQVPNAHDRNVINAEHERIRREEDERRRQQGS